LGSELVDAILEDWRTAPIEEPLRATLGFLEKLTLRPDEVDEEDIRPLREAGLSYSEIEDAIHVCVVFNHADRMMDALGAWHPTQEFADQFTQLWLEVGGAPPPLWGRELWLRALPRPWRRTRRKE